VGGVEVGTGGMDFRTFMHILERDERTLDAVDAHFHKVTTLPYLWLLLLHYAVDAHFHKAGASALSYSTTTPIALPRKLAADLARHVFCSLLWVRGWRVVCAMER
jgi:hypothetical protein